MTLNCIHIFIVTGSFLYWCVMRPASQRFFIHSCIYLRILIISYLATFLGTNSLSVLMCRKAVNRSINFSESQVLISLFLYTTSLSQISILFPKFLKTWSSICTTGVPNVPFSVLCFSATKLFLFFPLFPLFESLEPRTSGEVTTTPSRPICDCLLCRWVTTQLRLWLFYG